MKYASGARFDPPSSGGLVIATPAAASPVPRRESHRKRSGEADFKDLLIYRSALNADEVTALENGRLLQASLEIY